MSDKRYYINFKSKLSVLSKQNLRELFKFTQPTKGANDEILQPILYFSGTSSQSWKKHFQMFKNKYIKAESKPDETLMDKVDLFANYTYEFDFPEDGILKWNEWSRENPNYDPELFNLDDNHLSNINEDLLTGDIPEIIGDLSQNDEFRSSIKDSMDR